MSWESARGTSRTGESGELLDFQLLLLKLPSRCVVVFWNIFSIFCPSVFRHVLSHVVCPPPNIRKSANTLQTLGKALEHALGGSLTRARRAILPNAVARASHYVVTI